jgi:hypothetical protein
MVCIPKTQVHAATLSCLKICSQIYRGAWCDLSCASETKSQHALLTCSSHTTTGVA